MQIKHLACAAAMLAFGVAHAAPVSFQFTGVVDKAGDFGVALGAEVSGVITYDTATQPDFESGPIGPGLNLQLVSYNLTGIGSFDVNLAGKQLTTSTMGATIRDNLGGNHEEQIDFSGSGVKLDGLAYSGAYAVLTLATRPGVSDVLDRNLPSSINLADFDAPYFAHYGAVFKGDGLDSSTLTFNVTSITAVPEPASVVSMSLGLVGVLGLSLRRRRALQA